MSLLAKRSLGWRVLLGLTACATLFLGYYLVIVTPQAKIYRLKLQTLKPAEVQRITLTLDGQQITPRVLRAERALEFLRLLANAQSYSPNHPSGGWSCFVEIETTTETPRFSFLIRDTNNDGAQIWLCSSGRNGWNYGALRNDQLGDFIATVFAEPR